MSRKNRITIFRFEKVRDENVAKARLDQNNPAGGFAIVQDLNDKLEYAKVFTDEVERSFHVNFKQMIKAFGSNSSKTYRARFACYTLIFMLWHLLGMNYIQIISYLNLKGKRARLLTVLRAFRGDIFPGAWDIHRGMLLVVLEKGFDVKNLEVLDKIYNSSQ